MLNVTRYHLILMFIIPFSLLGQFSFDDKRDIVINNSEGALRDPWGGGFNSVIVSEIDFDFDGMTDLFLFDKSENEISIFLKKTTNGITYYSREYKAYQKFPNNLTKFVQCKDYNGDGKNDLFAFTDGGLKVYKNTGNSVSGLDWELESELLTSKFNSITTELAIGNFDIPSIEDIDFDGDLDILTFSQDGERILYHKNLSVENFNNQDSLNFELKNECWGKFIENSLTDSIEINSQNAYCNGGSELGDIQKSLHVGGSILALDLDGSGVMDLVLGDASREKLISLLNTGTGPNQDSPIFNPDYNFPNNTDPVTMFNFPSAYHLDVDNDNIKDIVVGVNDIGISQNKASLGYYKNIGTNTFPEFIFQRENFLQHEMLDVGEESFPVIVDIDADGLDDLLIANKYKYKDTLKKKVVIEAYTNIGTAENPEFLLLSDDWNTFSEIGIGFRVRPTFGDIDGDGDLDAMVGTEFGLIHLYLNVANTGEPMFLSNPVYQIQDNSNTIINVGSDSSPQLFDLNKDGLLDLIIGKNNGEISYYKNVGTATNHSFEFITDQLGMVDVNNTSLSGNSAPFFIEENDTIHLFVGSKSGKLYYYTNIESNLEDGDSFELNSDNFLDINTQSYSTPFITDIDSDGELNLFLGGGQGGVYSFENNNDIFLGVDNTYQNLNLSLYPNPTNSNITIDYNHEQYGDLTIELRTLDGRLIKNFSTTKSQTFFNLDEYVSGVYIAYILKNNSVISTNKIILNR